MLTTHRIGAPIVVALKVDFPKWGFSKGQQLTCTIDKFKHGDGYQIYRSGQYSYEGEPFHASFTDEEDFSSKFEVLGTEYMGSLSPASLRELKNKYQTNKN